MGKSTVYHLSIEVVSADTNADETVEPEAVANAYGSHRVVTFVARDALKGMVEAGGTYSVALVEVDRIGGDETRTIVETRGDAEICAYVLGKRLRAEKTAE